ncbi:MAG: TIGR01777 family protein [SAR324 cluster bacterium]|nr:TIGR01777 family protein [SAR324 cluster bacterium]
MPVHIHRTELPFSAEEVFAWHARPGARERLTPPWERVRVLEGPAGIAPGARTVLALRKGPLTLRWEARHGQKVEGRYFSDEQVRGPFARWMHTHRFVPRGERASLLEDEVDYALPLWPLGALVGGALVRRGLGRLFRLRHERTGNDLARHRRFAAHGPRKILVSGSSGLIGTRLCAFLSSGGHTVIRLLRGGAADNAVAWAPAAGEIDAAALEGLDAVVHLAGENIAAGRWSEKRKEAIRASRVDSTALLCRTLAGLSRKPGVLVAASAVGYYGDRGEGAVDEDAGAGEGYLAEVCQAWEAATDPARQAGIRVVNLRIGVVLAAEGGALQKMLPPFRLGLGGPLGNGRQFMSWIALEDLIGVIQQGIFDETLRGPVNAVAPEAVTNRDFGRMLGRVLRRPAAAPLPAGVVRLVFGEMGQALLLEGQRVLPKRLQAAGFEYVFPGLEGALRSELGL